VPKQGTAMLSTTSDESAPTLLAAPIVDLTKNTVDVRVAGAGDGAITINAGAGLWDTGTTAWSGDPAVVDLAFNTREQEGTESGFRDAAQSDAVAAGDVSAMTATVDLAALGARRTDAPITATGLYDAVFKSRQAVTEGYPASFPHYQGLYQPYVMWLPQNLDPTVPTPLVLVLHSLSNVHTQYRESVYTQVGGAIDAIAITPLAMGDDGWYWDEALVDTLDAWADVRKRFAIDPDHTFSSGYSMGGYGTYRLATLLPDLIAAGVSWVGPPTDGIWAGTEFTETTRTPGLTYNQLENTYNVPFFIVHGTNDELVPVLGVTRMAQRMYELGQEHRYNLHPGQDHLSFAIINDWSREAQWLQGRSRVTTPSRVSFKSRPATWADRDEDLPAAAKDVLLSHLRSLASELGGAAFDSAYWVRSVRVGGDPAADVTGFVDLTSAGIADRVPVTRDTTGVGVFGSSPHIIRGLDRTFTFAAPENALTGTLMNVTEVTVDLRRAHLSLTGLRLDITSDIGTLLHLVDGDQTHSVAIPPAAPPA
jgi:dienelactone hydrolase